MRDLKGKIDGQDVLLHRLGYRCHSDYAAYLPFQTRRLHSYSLARSWIFENRLSRLNYRPANFVIRATLRVRFPTPPSRVWFEIDDGSSLRSRQNLDVKVESEDGMMVAEWSGWLLQANREYRIKWSDERSEAMCDDNGDVGGDQGGGPPGSRKKKDTSAKKKDARKPNPSRKGRSAKG